MFLQNLIYEKKNTRVMVNGNIYCIAHDRVIRDEAGNPVDVPEIDAKKLLVNKGTWSLMGTAKPVKPTEKPTVKLITATGAVIDPKKVEVPQETPKTAPLATVKATEAIVDPIIPKKGDEWADPDVKFSMDWLQACAKAYGVKYKGKDKAVLVEKIKTEMYDE